MELPSQSPFEESFVVSADAVDANGHVNNVVYVQWMQDIATRHFYSVVEPEAMEAADATWVVHSHEITYRAAAFAGDRLTVRTWIADFRRVHSHREYRFLNGDNNRELVVGKTDWVYVAQTTGRPKAIPHWIQERFPTAPFS